MASFILLVMSSDIIIYVTNNVEGSKVYHTYVALEIS